ncbi:HNH endonuclease [Arthrobacter sp. KK5.5]|uniref:HNH endonuclease n=1 Tax=Arthrobacter sp. KK5.5 TaxID=3373084 RepID=UPI003EE7934C
MAGSLPKRAPWTTDEIILASDLVRKNQWRGLDDRNADVRELSALLRAHPFNPTVASDDPKYRNPSGVARKTWDIATSHPEYKGKQTRGNKLDGIVLGEFLADPAGMARLAASIREGLRAGIVPDEAQLEDLGEFEAPEGRVASILHNRRERNPKLRRRKLDSVRKAGHPIACEVCAFDFAEAYGQRGRDYIEVHHVLPLSISGETTTRLSDLALLCSNCHRVLHRTRPWITPADLRRIVQDVRG